VPVQIRTKEPEPAAKAVIARYLQVWTPTIILLSADGAVIHEWSGYLPPIPFLDQLLLGRGKDALKRDRFAEAAALFDQLADHNPLGDAAPEALYWAAVSRYKGSGNADDLMGGWAKLRSRYPESPWRVKQIFVEA